MREEKRLSEDQRAALAALKSGKNDGYSDRQPGERASH